MEARDRDRLCDPEYRIDIRVVRNRPTSESEISDFDPSGVIAALLHFADRDEALRHLAIVADTRKSIELVARHLSIPVTKSDKVEGLREKIVEATVGARLRSQAIRGE